MLQPDDGSIRYERRRDDVSSFLLCLVTTACRNTVCGEYGIFRCCYPERTSVHHVLGDCDQPKNIDIHANWSV